MKYTQPIVFCDFDGTITERESLEAVLRKFNPENHDAMMARLKAGQVSIREGVREMVEGIASARYPEILSYVREIPIRPGFEALLDFLDERGIPFVVLSGGLRGMVEARLGPLVRRAHHIIAADVDVSQPRLSVLSNYESETELVAKARVMDTFSFDAAIVIGDGITDFEMARHGTCIFARDSLADYLERQGIGYHTWLDFYDIRDKLATKEGCTSR